MNKKSDIFVILIIFTCCTLATYMLFNNKVSYSGKLTEGNDGVYSNKLADIISGDFNNINKDFKKFDVADFAEAKTNTIDIASKEYINGSVTTLDTDFVISEDLLNRINATINSYGAACSFYIVSLNDGMSIGYNVDKGFETASSIKAPYALYLYEEMDKGNVDGNNLIEYQPRHYNKGTGVVKSADFGTAFTVYDLIYYSLFESDNVAHTMLHNTYGVSGYNDFLRGLGTKQLYLTSGNPWGFTSARSAALIWQEIYNFSIRSEYGIEFLNILSNAKYNYFKEIMPDIPSAGKAGFASYDVVETGIVFDKTPYIGVAIANRGGNIGAYTQVLRLIELMNGIMIEYNDYLGVK